MAKTTKDNAIEFELNGTIYRRPDAKKNYVYKSTGKTDGKGNPVMMRIPLHIFEQAFDEYVDQNDDIADADEAYNERKEAQAKADAETEQNFNGKRAKSEVDHYTVRTFYAGMTGYVVEKNGVEVYNGFSVDEIIERFGFNPNEVTEIDIPRKKETKRASKPRKSKDVAFEHTFKNGKVVTLTAKQVDFIKHIPDTCFYENGLESTMWCDVLADEIGGQFAGKPMTVGAMISTLREKDVISVGVDKDRNGRKAKFFAFTDMGKKVAEELGLN